MQPVFIIGAQRSGTTLLRLMLNAHSQIAIPEEGTFLMPLLRRHKRFPHRIIKEKVLAKYITYIRKNHQFRLWRFDGDAFFNDVRVKPSSMSGLAGGLYAAYAKQQGKSVWGDKTPSFFRMVPVLSRMFPEARFIHIIRDGRAVHASWKKIDSLRSNPAVNGLEWSFKINRAMKDLKRNATGRSFQIRFEDLVEAPERTLRLVCAFLEIAFEKEMLDYWKESRKHIGRHHSARIFLPPDRSAVESWRRELIKNEAMVVERVAGKTLRVCGYPTDDSERAEWPIFLTSCRLLVSGVPGRMYQVFRTAALLSMAVLLGLSTRLSGGGEAPVDGDKETESDSRT